MVKKIPYFAIGNGELESHAKVGKMAACPKCGTKRVVRTSKELGFINCCKSTYLVSVNGRLIK